MKTKIIRIGLLSAIIFLAASCNFLSPEKSVYTDGVAKLGEQEVKIDLVSTAAERALGLGGRTELSEYEGMYFYFDQDGTHGFWMKGMLFAIDIVWIKDGRIVDITRRVRPQIGVSDAELTVYYPKEQVDAVLELKAGWSDRHGLQDGDVVELILP